MFLACEDTAEKKLDFILVLWYILDTIQTSRRIAKFQWFGGVILREFDIKVVNDLVKKLYVTKDYAAYYKALSFENIGNSYFDRFNKKSSRLDDCLNFFKWDKYEVNKVMDLQRVNRCMDKFCPNCKCVAINQAIYNFMPQHKYLISNGYSPFLFTATVPNVDGGSLESTIKKMNKAFSKFNIWLSKSLESRKGFSGRFCTFSAIIKVLEVTIQKDDHSMYHPHFHCIVYSDDLVYDNFLKIYKGPFSKKYNSYLYYSDLDIQLSKLWYFAFNDISIKKFDSYSVISNNELIFDTKKNAYSVYLCDIRPFDEKGIYEVFKYTFKDSDIYGLDNFRTLFFALEGKRLRQGYGLLYGLKLDDEELEFDREKEDIEYYLLIDKKEKPEGLITRDLKCLNIEYSKYRKISRFLNFKDIE